MKKYFFFDLDGTLCDTGEGVLNGVIFALSHFWDQCDGQSFARWIHGTSA